VWERFGIELQEAYVCYFSDWESKAIEPRRFNIKAAPEAICYGQKVTYTSEGI